MTLDPVHFDGIASLARQIDHDVDDTDHRDFAETVWKDFLDPLYHGGRAVLEPIDDVRRQCVDTETVALQEDAFETAHGVDSGTINPRTFRNGLVLDIAQAAMSATPSDLDLHRSRTVIATVHSNDATVQMDDDWTKFDAGYSKGQVVKIPRISRYEDAVVHALSLYLAESRHALDHADVVDDLLVLDGPVYPKAILNWLDRDAELAELVTTEETPQSILRNYVRLVDEFVTRDVPLIGFVKNISSRSLVDTLRKKTTAPWAHDAALFSQILERGEFVDGEFERRTDELSFTNWFVSRMGPDAVFAPDDDTLEIDRELTPESYEVSFFVVYDPRDDIAYKIETPRAFAEDDDLRERIERQVLKEIAVNRGPPLAIQKADSLARIGTNERRSLIEKLEATFESKEDRTYDDKRWGIDY
ncbi:DNA double-strand break repair nuclease NurA [Haladaptatus sp. NG-SE-30]